MNGSHYKLADCILCHPICENEKILFESNHSLYLLSRNPEIEGAGIIIPKDHRETVFDLSSEEWNDCYQLLHKVREYIDQTYQPDGYNIGWNCGEVGGQHLFHSHLHVIPRFSNEPMAGKGIRYLFKSKENRRS